MLETGFCHAWCSCPTGARREERSDGKIEGGQLLTQTEESLYWCEGITTAMDWHDHIGSVAVRETLQALGRKSDYDSCCKTEEKLYILRARMWCFECEPEQKKKYSDCMRVCNLRSGDRI